MTKEFKKGQWYKIRLRVTAERIQGWIDEKRYVDQDTKDRKLSAQWEHTLLVTETGYEIFTLRSDDTIARISA